VRRRSGEPTGVFLVVTPPEPPECDCIPPLGTDKVGQGSKWRCNNCGMVWTKDWQGWLGEVRGTPPPDSVVPVSQDRSNDGHN
jgi:hypothetical protein